MPKIVHLAQVQCKHVQYFYQVEKFVMKQKEELKKRASAMAKKSLGSIKTVASYAGEKIEKAR